MPRVRPTRSYVVSGVLVSVTVVLGLALFTLGRLPGWTPFAVGAVGGLVSVPVVVAQSLVLRFAKRPSPTMVAGVIPWIVAPLSLALLVASVQLLAVGPLCRHLALAGPQCGDPPSLDELVAGSWSFEPEAVPGPTIRLTRAGRPAITWALADDGRGSGARIAIDCQH